MCRGVGVLQITRNGSKYIDGDLEAKGGEGFGFHGTFTANSLGEIVKANVIRSGEYFLYDPEMILVYTGSYLPQNKSVTGFDINVGKFCDFW